MTHPKLGCGDVSPAERSATSAARWRRKASRAWEEWEAGTEAAAASRGAATRQRVLRARWMKEGAVAAGAGAGAAAPSGGGGMFRGCGGAWVCAP